jgi:Outer membrane protein beta-barrel domain
MKQIILLFACTMLFAAHTIAQVRFGIRAGLNLAHIAGKGFEAADITPTLLPSYHVGGVTELGISKNFSLETGLFVSGKGIKFEGSTPIGTATVSLKPVYLEIPFNALYKADVGNATLHFFSGPYLGLGIAGQFKIVLANETISENINFGTANNSTLKALDFGFNLGWGIEIHHFMIRGQYGLGWTNLDPQGQSKLDKRHRVIGISFGYMFGGK